MKNKNCLNCGKELTGKQQKHCCQFCEKKINREKDREKVREYQRIWYQNNKERVKEYQKKNKKRIKRIAKIYRDNNKEKIRKRTIKYRGDNKENLKKYRRAYEINNREKIRIVRRKYYKDNEERLKKNRKRYERENRNVMAKKRRLYRRKRWSSDFIFRLNHRMGSSIRESLRMKNIFKNGYSWESLVGYTKQDLKEHLENLFTESMSWQNYGEWHLDHIIPISFFQYSSTDDVEFKYCWSLNNLQPLWAKENWSKNDKIDSKYFEKNN
jgi:hypothetical protein